MPVRLLAFCVFLIAVGLLLTAGCGGVADRNGPSAPPEDDAAPAVAAAVPAAAPTAGEAGALFAANFDSAEPLDWTVKGDVSVDETTAFAGGRSLVLARSEDQLTQPVVATSPAFAIEQGMLEITLAVKTDLVSPDNSYNGTVELELIDAGGRTSRGPLIAEQDGQHNWTQVRKRVEIPASYTSARLKAQINKTSGRFWVDQIAVQRAAVEGDDAVVNRIFFETAQMGNLLYPEDPRTVKVTAWTLRPLSEDERQVRCVVRDYWGARQAEPMVAALSAAGRKDAMHVYQGSIDLSAVPLAVGRYYELHATLDKADGRPFTNHTSLAILPEAPANSYPADRVPFTSRTWDARVEAAHHLTRRLGVRISGIWGGWNSTPPYTVRAPQFETVEKLGMGWLTGIPTSAIERRSPGHEKYTEQVLREGVRKFIATYGHLKPMVISLGNEPHNKGDAVKLNVAAYRAIYQEVKQIDPSIIVLGTSVGPEEDFFKAGFGEWCDAYDFHVYGDSAQVRDIIENQYPALFERYGHKKPIWSTELGLNSQGMARLPVAVEVVRKLSTFFAAGGANCSWFSILYPDPDAVIAGSSSEAHNLFDSRYSKYAPKLDAIAYYNMVNGIAIKRFVAEKVYDPDLRAFLFRDDQGQALQIYYTDKGRRDVKIPLPGVQQVRVIRIDGSISDLHAAGEGITLTVGEDPVLLLYEGGPAGLAETLAEPVAQLIEPMESIVSGSQGVLTVRHGRLDPERIAVLAQPGWRVVPQAAKALGTARFALVSPAGCDARAVDTVVRISNDAGQAIGELYHRPRVLGAIEMSLLPTPAAGDRPPGVTLVIGNNGAAAQEIGWAVTLLGEKAIHNGAYPTKPKPARAYLATTPSGTITLAAGATERVFVPLAQVDPHTVYLMRAVATDASGRQVVDERPVGGFVGVPRAVERVTIDGAIDEAAWQAAPVLTIDRADQFYCFGKPQRDQLWTGPQDLSARIRYLWDDQYLYIAVSVTDDIRGGLKADDSGWAQDGLQFLVDPTRTAALKVGKYDYSVALGTKGVQAWCYLSADSAAAPPGEVRDMAVAIRRGEDGRGDAVYEIAVPWNRLAPFQPRAGANLGFTLIVNEDDGPGRDSFMTWFGNAHSKDIDTVGDLILLPE